MGAIDIAGLSAEERLELISRLWDSLGDAAGLSPAQRAELDRRLDAADREAGAGRAWASVRTELAARR